MSDRITGILLILIACGLAIYALERGEGDTQDALLLIAFLVGMTGLYGAVDG